MRNHFDQHLYVRQLILDHRPECILELGCAEGANSAQIWGLRGIHPFRLVCVDDAHDALNAMGIVEHPQFAFHRAVSYHFLKTLPDASVDLCIIDTDHNYWTLWQELTGLHPKLREGGIVALHDTESFGHAHGVKETYGTKDPYPSDQIAAHAGKGLLDAINQFRQEHSEYRVIRETQESCGAMAMQKGGAPCQN